MNKYPQCSFTCINSLVTGYADDEMMIETYDEGEKYEANYLFDHCIIRTPKITTEDSIHFVNVILRNMRIR